MSPADGGSAAEAGDNKQREKAAGKYRIKRIIIAACAVLFISGGIWFFYSQGGLLPGPPAAGHADDAAFTYYTGPVMPLNIIGDAEGIAADRSIHFDFTLEEKGSRDMRVTDGYTLTNGTAGDKKVEIVYPFVSSISEVDRLAPVLTVNGGSLRAELLAGDYAGTFTGDKGHTSNRSNIESWEGYKALLTDGGYLEAAKSEKAFIADRTVTVYTFCDVTYPKEEGAAALAMEFYLPRGSSVIVNGMNGGSFDKENSFYRCSFTVAHSTGQRVIVLGEPPGEYTVQGYENGGYQKKLGSVTGKVMAQTMQFSQAVRDCMAEYRMKQGSPGQESSLLTDALLYRAVVSMFRYTLLGDHPVDRYGWMRLDELIGEAYAVPRMLYLKAPLAIPAGQSVKVESRFQKEGSCDYARKPWGANSGVWGYDMTTRLGSSVHFTGQKASLDLPQSYEIVRQNFGFDRAKGITEVALDLDEERYYLEIKSTDQGG